MGDESEHVVAAGEQAIGCASLYPQHPVGLSALVRQQLNDRPALLGTLVEQSGVGFGVLGPDDGIGEVPCVQDLRLVGCVRVGGIQHLVLALPRKLEDPTRTVARSLDHVVRGLAERGRALQKLVVRTRTLGSKLAVRDVSRLVWTLGLPHHYCLPDATTGCAPPRSTSTGTSPNCVSTSRRSPRSISTIDQRIHSGQGR